MSISSKPLAGNANTPSVACPNSFLTMLRAAAFKLAAPVKDSAALFQVGNSTFNAPAIILSALSLLALI